MESWKGGKRIDGERRKELAGKFIAYSTLYSVGESHLQYLPYPNSQDGLGLIAGPGGFSFPPPFPPPFPLLPPPLPPSSSSFFPASVAGFITSSCSSLVVSTLSTNPISSACCA